MPRTSNTSEEKMIAEVQNDVREVWQAALRAGFDNMGKFPKQYADGFDITRRKDVAGDFAAAASILVNLESELRGLGFKTKIWENDNLSHQYSSSTLVASMGMNRKGIYFYVSTR